MNTTAAIIRQTYRQLATRPGQWIKLARIIEVGFAGQVPADWAQVVKQMDLSGQANVVPNEDQKTLRDADRRVAVTIGGTKNHEILVK